MADEKKLKNPQNLISMRENVNLTVFAGAGEYIKGDRYKKEFVPLLGLELLSKTGKVYVTYGYSNSQE